MPSPGDTPARVHVPPPRPGSLPDQLAAAITQAIAPLQQRLGAMDDELGRQGNILNGLLGQLNLRAEQQGQEDADAVRVPVADTLWACRKCGRRLGMYDAAEDVMRLRHKDFLVHAHAGVGGWVRVACTGCGELNVVEYATGVTEQDGALPQVNVVGDRLVLDEPLLAHLLALVQAGDGRLVVQLVQAPQPSPL